MEVHSEAPLEASPEQLLEQGSESIRPAFMLG